MNERQLTVAGPYSASHSIICNVQPDELYRLICDSRNWPSVLEPCRSVTVLEEGADHERIQLTAAVNGVEMTWQSHRRFLPDVLGIDVEIVEPMKLVDVMVVHWRVIRLNGQQSLLLLEHDYSLCDDVAGQVRGVVTLADAVRFIERGIDCNSRVELANFKAAAERVAAADPQRDFQSTHSIVCNAPADRVYALIRDTSNWPDIFDACVGASVEESWPSCELVRIEAMQAGNRVSWTTQRSYRDAARRIDYHLPVPMPFLESMSGTWRVVTLEPERCFLPERCLLTVNRRWRMLADVSGIREGVTTVAEAAAQVAAMVDDNARAEMASIRALVERGDSRPTSVVTRFRVPRDPRELYELLADVSFWPQVLPHCESLRLRYDDSVHQEFTMHVAAPGGIETFRSVRHCDADALTITYFQPEPPPVLVSHRGSWEVRSAGAGSEVIARHMVVLDREACAKAFGTTDAREQENRVRERLEGNSRLTVETLARWLGAHPGGKRALAGMLVHD